MTLIKCIIILAVSCFKIKRQGEVKMTTQAEHDKQAEVKEHGASIVDIMIDEKQLKIHRGHQTVVELKTLGGVPLAYDLDQIINGKFQPLLDDGAVALKGGEIFVSHPKDGSSA